ncbi:MAG: sigma-54 dependent transcriptional regulator [Planctomycetota bacterium]
MTTLLVLDQATRSRHALVARLEAAGHHVIVAETVSAARAVDPGALDAVVAERALGGEDLARAWIDAPDAPSIVLLDAFATCAERDSPPSGVAEMLPRPVADATVVAAVARVIAERRLQRENRLLRAGEEGEAANFGELISRDAGMQRIFQTLRTVADSRATILLQGESGTGKTAFARGLHAASNRRDEPFVGVNCGALPESLLASELFGHAKGAFTGAVADRIGKFEAADGGTLFLDEIGTASMDLQVKLLRVLEEGRFERVGESRTREADVRIVAATNEDLAAAVEARTFRMDLYYRLNVVGVDVPPLRDRPDDVLLLAERFLGRFGARHARAVASFAPRALRRLAAHPWPGNVRELQNTIERAVLLAQGAELEVIDLWPDDAEGSEAEAATPWSLQDDVPLREVVETAERWWILRALGLESGSRQDTARRLGINRTTLFNKMRKYALLSFPTDGDADDRDLGRTG